MGTRIEVGGNNSDNKLFLFKSQGYLKIKKPYPISIE
jgi:hypothetical protein